MKKTIIILLLSSIFPYGISAQELLSLEQCREMALQHNKMIVSATKQTEYAQYMSSSYKANFFPDIKLGGTGLYSTADGYLPIPGGNLPVLTPDLSGNLSPNGSYAYFPGFDFNYKLGWVYTGGITIQQPIYWGGKISSAYKISLLGKDMAKLNERLTKTDIIIATDHAYVNVIKAKEMQKVVSIYHETLAELMRNVESAYRHGLKPQNDVLKVRVKLNEAELNIKKAENALRLATMNLCHYIGKPLYEKIVVSDEFPIVENISNLPHNDISLRPEFEMLDKQVEINRQQVKLSRSELLPRISFQGGYNYMNGIEINDSKLFEGGSFSALINVSIPIFHFGERSNKVKAAKVKLQQSILERQDKNELMKLELAQVTNNLEEAQLECNITETSLALADENRRVSTEQYKLGLETLSELLEAQTLWQQAWQAKVDAHFRLYLQWIAYQKAIGVLSA